MSNTFKIDVSVKLPKVPNFFRMEGGKSLPIQNFDDATLRKIGEQWTDSLLKNAKEKRVKKPVRTRKDSTKTEGKDAK